MVLTAILAVGSLTVAVALGLGSRGRPRPQELVVRVDGRRRGER